MKPLKAGGYGPKTKEIKDLLDSQIMDLATLQRQLSGAVLVAFDTKGHTQHVGGASGATELAVAVLRITDGRPHFIPDMSLFCKENQVNVLTISISPRLPPNFIGTLKVTSAESAGPRLQEFISEHHGTRILVGFNMRDEIRWIAEECPSFAKLFSGWCDVQHLVSERYKELAPQPDEAPHRQPDPGLRTAMKTMQIRGLAGHQYNSVAGVNAVKMLAILSGLLSAAPFELHDRSGKPKPNMLSVFCSFPKSKTAKTIHLFSAYITMKDGSELPSLTPNGLLKKWKHYTGLKAVGMKAPHASSLVEAKVWWASFDSRETLNKFANNIRGEGFKVSSRNEDVLDTFEDDEIFGLFSADSESQSSPDKEMWFPIEGKGCCVDHSVPLSVDNTLSVTNVNTERKSGPDIGLWVIGLKEGAGLGVAKRKYRDLNSGNPRPTKQPIDSSKRSSWPIVGNF